MAIRLKAQPCLSDPFNTLDDPSNTLDGCMAKTEFDTARTNRWTFCLKEGNATHSICEPVAYLCSIAVGDVDVRCKTNTTGVTVAGDYCDDIANANTATCNVTVAFCADSANEGKAPCGVNTARWAEYAYSVDEGALPDASDDTTTKAPILETILSTSDETGFINLPEVTYDPPDEGEDPGPKQKEALEAAAATPMDVMEVNLNLLTLGNHKVGSDPAVNLLGEEEDGAFFFNGIQNARNIFYAGITATTDLGAPLVAPDGVDAPTKLTWNGRIHLYANIYGGIALRSDDFQLEIDFDDSTLKSETTIIHPRDTAVVTITGKFDRFGLVYGTTTLNLNTAGMYGGLLTGLIGIEGAVGAFVSNSESSLDFAGAFVANDKVCTLQPFGAKCFKEFNEERAMIADGCSGAGLSPIPPEMLVAPIAPEIATKMAKIAECAAAKPFICVATSRNYDARFAAGEDYSNPFASLCSGIESVALVALKREACIAGTPASSDATFPVGESCSTLITAGGVTANIWEHTAEKTDGTKLAIRKTIERVYDKTRALDPDVEDVEFWGAEQTVASVLARDEITEFAPITLNLADGGLANDGSVDPNDNLNLLGDAGDGAAFGRVTWAATDDGMPILSKKFAWILPTTDLGAELTAPSEGAPTTAIWHGRASLLISELTAEATAVEATYSFNNFELMVDFTNRTLASTGNTRDTGTTTETTTPRVNDDDFVIDLEVEGSFADGKYGLITGTTTVTTSSSGDGGSKFPLESYTGILTGLIGADGAVGAFISDHGRQDYEYVGAFVASDKICTNDPFHARCLDQFDDTRTELIKNCTGASPDLVKCAVVKERICSLSGDDADPFAELCEGEGTEADVREANDRRQEACLQDASAWEAKYEGLVCTDHIKTGGASANLWTYTAKKTDGMTDLTIRNTIERTYDTNDLPTDFWVADKTAEELLTISNLDTTPNSNLAGAPDFNRLDLDDTYDDPRGTGRTIGFGGDAEDGAISFRAEWRDGGTTTIKHFAGILPTTNLGAQVELVAPSTSGAVTTGYWHGRVVFQGFDTIYKTDDLELEIDFASDMRKITARPELLNNVNGNAGTLRIDGKFDENGLITGTTDFRATGSVNTARTGILTGLIGVEGAVAAFISDSDTDYAGVFVANDNVCGQNPFDVLCGADFKEQRNQVVINCSVESPDIAACANAKPFICVTTRSNYNTEYNPDQFAAEEDYTNPFVKLCEGDGTEDALRQAKVLRQLACLIDTEESEREERALREECATGTHIADGGATASVWTYTATKTDKTTDVTTRLTIRDEIKEVYDTDTNDAPVEFWVADKTETQLNANASFTTSDFNKITHAIDYTDKAGEAMMGDDKDGAIIFSATWGQAPSQTTKSFVGILPTTDLGAPLPLPTLDEPTMAVWHGRATVLFGGTKVEFNNFELMVDFTNRTIDSRSVGTDDLTKILEIDGSFATDANGLITGTTTVLDIITPAITNTDGVITTPAITDDYTGILTGLIGEDGAVGAFISDGMVISQAAQTPASIPYVGAFVANDKICENDPFNALCRETFNDARQTLYNDCVADDPSEHSRCNDIIACFNNPYSDDALCQFDLFTDEKKRLDNLCTTGINFRTKDTMEDTECAVVNMAVPCVENPFKTLDGDCLADDSDRDTLITARANRIAFCVDSERFTTAATRDDCVPALYHCAVNPDSTGCPAIQDTIVNICKLSAAADSAFCGLNIARWAEHSYTRAGNAPDGDKESVTIYPNYKAVPSVGDSKAGFLHGADSGLGDDDRVPTTEFTVTTLHFGSNFNDTYEDENKNTIGFSGDATGGFTATIFQNFDFNGFESYAGILPDINVGAPLRNSEVEMKATWRGRLHARIEGTLETTPNFDFKLMVDFKDKSLTIEQTHMVTDFSGDTFLVHQFGSSIRYIAFKNVKYDNAGLISGQVEGRFDKKDPIIATLTGLIGAKGAVGAFIVSGVTGGFIASPEIGVVTSSQFDIWEQTATSARVAAFAIGGRLKILTEISKTDADANFLAGGTVRQYLRLAEGLGESDATLIPETLETLTLADTYRDSNALIADLGGDITNGVSLFAVDVTTADTTDNPSAKSTRFYSGLLAETTLTPLVLTNPAPVASWKGRFAMLYDKTKIPTLIEDFAIDFYFDDLGYRDIPNTEIADDGGRRFDASVNVPHPDGTSNDVGFTIQGTFSTSGLLRGRITEAGTAFYGDITGLVGTNGVVASFASTDTTGTFGPYVGGFVARNDDDITRSLPSPDFETWTKRAVDSIEVTPVTDPKTYTHPRLTILDGISSDDTNFFNFVEGGATDIRKNIKVDKISTSNQLNIIGHFADTTTTKTGADAHDLSIPITLTLGDTYLRGEQDFNLDGDVADGISFLIGRAGAGNRAYAGLLSGTDLGAPIDASLSGKWQGQAYQLGYRAFINSGEFFSLGLQRVVSIRNFDFTLDVDFVNKTIDGDIEYIGGASPFRLVIDGAFDVETGIVSGTATAPVVSGSPRTVALTGLIGAEGLVAVYGASPQPTTSVLQTQILGGFVARPVDHIIETTGTVTTADWHRGFNFNDRPRVGAFENPAHFLRGDKYGLATGDFDSVVVTGQTAGADPQPVTQRFLKLDNDNEDGVSFLAGTRGDTTRYYSGLLSTTDVGKPLDDGTQTLYWAGTIGVIWSDNTYHEDTFDLIVDFDTQTIKSASHIEPEGRNIIILNGKNVIIEASWELTVDVLPGDIRVTTNPRGRINGTIKGLDSLVAGTLTGLIGQDGAVGSFISGAGTEVVPATNHYAGGFVALEKSTFIDWRGGFGNTPPDTAPNPILRNQFLQGTADNLTATPSVPESNLITELWANNDGTGTINPTLLNLQTATFDGTNDARNNPTPLGGDASDGVGFFTGYNGGVQYYYAGILNGTNLGAPLTAETATGVWNGKFRAIGQAVNTDFTLEVTFGDTMDAAGSVEAFVEQNSATNTYYHLTGTYDSNGFISGDVDFGGFSNLAERTPTGDRTSGALTGLIGQDGAVGAFYSDTTGNTSNGFAGYAGGFVACPYDVVNNRCKQ